MIFDILEDKLSPIGLVQGQTLFRYQIPASVNSAVMLSISIAGLKVDPEIRGRYSGDFQVVVRNSSIELGEKIALQCQDLLELKFGRVIFEATNNHGAGFIDKFIPYTLPIKMNRLDGNGYEWSQYFRTVFAITNTI